ncbi:hypothetical protein [Chryseobacterium taichungense]|uniref:hypothetical protein n=1 Tax=Chryseobacterium taichungense TaxID=295069 RepID=UPI0028AFDADC|nr:hypothetical protein [Chryseobacterium taichungense]
MKTDFILTKIKDYNPCKDGFQTAVKDSSMKSLCSLFFANSDWALRENFPSKEVLQKYRGYYEQYGVFYQSNSLLKGLRMAIFDCVSELSFSGFDISEIIIRGNSKITVKASDYSKLFITVLDDAELIIEREETANVNIFRYGGKVSGDGEVKECRWD